MRVDRDVRKAKGMRKGVNITAIISIDEWGMGVTQSLIRRGERADEDGEVKERKRKERRRMRKREKEEKEGWIHISHGQGLVFRQFGVGGHGSGTGGNILMGVRRDRRAFDKFIQFIDRPGNIFRGLEVVSLVLPEKQEVGTNKPY